MKYLYLLLIFSSTFFSSLTFANSTHVDRLEKEFLEICRQYKEKVELARHYKTNNNESPHPLTPSKKDKKLNLFYLDSLFTHSLLKAESKVLIQNLTSQKCLHTLREFSILVEEEAEKKALDDFYAYYQTHGVDTLSKNASLEEKYKKLEKMMAIPKGFSYPFLKQYLHLVAGPLEILPNSHYKRQIKIDHTFKSNSADLSGKHVTFVGAGFPLSGVVLNLLSGAKVNLIDIDPNAIKRAKGFLGILDKAGIISAKNFSLKLADGKDLAYDQGNVVQDGIKTDILYLAAALPTDVKREIFKKIASEQNKKLVIIDRYVSGMYKILYENKVKSSEIGDFKTLGKIYPNLLYTQKIKDHKKSVPIKEAKGTQCSTRILMLR